MTGITQSNTYLLVIYCVIGIMLEAPGDTTMRLLPQTACNYTNGGDNDKNSLICRVLCMAIGAKLLLLCEIKVGYN